MANACPSIQKISWLEAREEIKVVNIGLYNLINQYETDVNRLPLYKVSYPFGSKILQEGVLQIPNKYGDLVSVYDSSVDSQLQNNLTYSTYPLGIIVKNHTEVYYEMPDRIIPLRIFSPGVILGLWESLDEGPTFHSRFIWNVVSGARSLFLLTKLSDANCFKSLCKDYAIQAKIPRRFMDQWHVFVELANHKDFPEKWTTDIIYFSAKWLDPKYNKAWLPFHHDLLREAWQLSQYARNKETLSIVWDIFSRSLNERNQKTNSYLMQTLQHLTAIATGALPGFIPAGQKDDVAPIKSIQKILIDSYGLKEYIPTMMHLANLSTTNRTLYYSLQTPTIVGALPKSKDVRSILNDLRELKLIVGDFISDAKSGLLKIENTPYYDMINNINFDYFHCNIDKSQDIKSIKAMTRQNPTLLDYPDELHSKKRRFAESSTFFRGCVSISKKEISNQEAS